MKFYYMLLLSVVLVGQSAFAQTSDMLSLQSVGKSSNGAPEGPAALCDDLESLLAGDLNGQTSAVGLLWTSFDATVVDTGSNIEISQIANLGTDAFQVEVFADIAAAGIAPVLDNGTTISVDYTYSDLGTDRFYSPQDANAGLILTRLGDPDGDGDWDVLDTDGAGGGIFVDSGVAIDLSGTIVFEVNDLALEITVNGVSVFSGVIIGGNGDPGLTPPEGLTSFVWQSANNADGLGSEEIIDNFAINTDPCGGGGPVLLGDVNLDGVVDLLDVNPFVALITDNVFQAEGDINMDGVVDLLDVAGFVAILVGP